MAFPDHPKASSLKTVRQAKRRPEWAMQEQPDSRTVFVLIKNILIVLICDKRIRDMQDTPNDYPFERIWDVLKREEPEPLSEEDGYRWGISHIEYVKKELLKLEERALARRDEELLHNIVNSKLHALEVEQELREKLNRTLQ